MKISDYKNKEKGRDVVILGNGPSVLDVDFDQLNNPIYIGLNGSLMLEDMKEIRHDYYVLSDARFVADPNKMSMLEKHLNKDTVCFFRRELYEKTNGMLNETHYIRSLGRDGFSFDLKRGYYFGCTTVALALQLAAYLGAGRIILTGVDLTYSGDMPRYYKEVVVHEVDNFSCVQITNIRNAFKLLEEVNIELLSASKESMLRPYLPYLNLSNGS